MPAPTQIAHYKITAKLGEGGMGAVYRATDTKLNREVAIKILPDALDADRVARFAREAQVLAALNHPNIATIYGVEERAIIMELVDGQPLKGPVGEDAALGLITQLIDALEYAHDKGIIHRDLKPANILVTADGRVKVLDFGLAKALAGERVGTGDPETSPTLTMRATEVGLIMGTASYMSPEQARGATVDKRADIWSFGVVLYELLTGKQLFGGDNVSDILADVLKQEIDFARVPSRFRKLVTLCLTRDPKLRMRDISAARHFLDDVVQQVAAKPSRLPWAVAAGASLLAAGTTFLWLSPKPTPPAAGAVRFQIPLPDGVRLLPARSVASAVPSPDGNHIALVLSDKQGTAQLWIRSLASTQIRKLDRTENASTPFWSPDSQSIAYFIEDKLMRVAIAGGTVQAICSYQSDSSGGRINGGAWGEDGAIVFGLGDGPLQRVPAAGGVPVPMSKLDKDESAHRYPQFLPGGKQILFLASKQSNAESTIEVLDIASGKRAILTKNATKAVWAPPGFLLFARDDLILAQKMLLSTLGLEGEPVTIADGANVNPSNGRSSFMVSPTGALAYRRLRGIGDAASLLAWYDRNGKRGDVFQKDGHPSDPAFSPDGKTVAMYHSDRTSHLWIADVASGVSTRLTGTGDLATYNLPIWSADSKRIIVSELAGGGIREIDVGSGKESKILSGGYTANSWGPDEKSLLVAPFGGKTLFDLAPGPGSQPRRIAESPDSRSNYRLSPDGRFVSYVSLAEARVELFVASYPGFDQRKKISSLVSGSSLWGQSGKELYFWDGDGTVYAANVRTLPGLAVDPPVALFRVPNRRPRSGFAVTADGQRFLIPEASGTPGEDDSGIHVIVNWQAGLPK